jgi:hypothetical protein
VLNTTGSLELILDAGETFQDTNVLIKSDDPMSAVAGKADIARTVAHVAEC